MIKDKRMQGWVPVNTNYDGHFNEWDLNYLSRTRSGAWKKLLDSYKASGLNHSKLYRRGWRVIRVTVTLQQHQKPVRIENQSPDDEDYLKVGGTD